MLESGWTNIERRGKFLGTSVDLVPDSRRFEPGSLNTSGIYGLRAAIDLLLGIGIEEIGREVIRIATLLAGGLESIGFEVRTPRPIRSGIVGAAVSEGRELLRLHGELEKEGITIRESTFGLQGILVEDGPLTRRVPGKKEWEDIRYGWEVAGEVGRLDIGQCVVIKERVVVAVEAAEGTDETIRRGGALAREGAVVIKRSKPQQDLRFDLPAVGPTTVETMASVKASVLAVEAGRSVLLDREMTLCKADQAGIVACHCAA